jgi:23S rRNA (uridine2552-2'-O)-methyltransferase
VRGRAGVRTTTLRVMPRARELHDEFFRRAKAEGYAARSAYKLKQIQARFGVIRRGDRVLDLGCAPGSWVQVAGELVGPEGLVVGIDLLPVSIAAPSNARTMIGDVFRVGAEELLALGGAADPRVARFDCVLSDMAPNTVGTGDDLRSARLCRRVLEVLPGSLRAGGSLVMKVLEGGEYPVLLRETGLLFRSCRGFRPEATRDVSREIYLIGQGYRGGTPAASGGGA